MYATGDLILSCEVYAHVVAPEVRSHVCDYCLERKGIFCSVGEPEQLRRCSKCQIVYYCDTNCQRAAWSDHRSECGYLNAVRPRQPPGLVRLLLRLLARHRASPHLADQLPGGGPPRTYGQLKVHREDIAADKKRAAAFQSFLQVLQDCVGCELYLPSDVFDAYCKVLINAVEITDPCGDAIGTGLYLGLSAVDHACRPNANVVFKSRRAELRAMEQLTDFKSCRISYLHEMLPTEERQQLLREQYYFSCDCRLCADQPADGDIVCGQLRCAACGAAVQFRTSRQCTQCGETVSDPAVKLYEDLLISSKKPVDTASSIKLFDSIETIAHFWDVTRIHLAERAMRSALDRQQVDRFYSIGLSLVENYKGFFHSNSIPLGLFSAKMSKAAFYVGDDKAGAEFLKTALSICKITYGEHSPYYHYLLHIGPPSLCL